MTDCEDIYIRYFKDVYKYVLSICKNKTVAEDITQETFFKAIKGIDNFDRKCKMRVWLCQIAKNTYFSYYEREKIYTDLSDVQEWGKTESFEERLISNEQAFEIHKALHLMDEPYKEVFTLRLFGELSFMQIAELFSKTESWARVTYHRARVKLKEDLM